VTNAYVATASAAAVVLLTCVWASANELVSYVFVQPDGTLRLSGSTVRLYGIYVPPTEQSCRTFERPVQCSSRAALALDFHIGVEFVHCEERATHTDGSISALCRVRGEDLSAWMLQSGWALALPDAPFEYAALEKIARARALGVWGLSGEIRRDTR
jgi:endonuclease YncB( thermonuclease family)